MSAQNRAQGSAPASAEGLDLTAAVEAAEVAAGLLGLPGRTDRAVQAAAPHVLRAAAERLDAWLSKAGEGSNWDHGADSAIGQLRALADEIGGGRG